MNKWIIRGLIVAKTAVVVGGIIWAASMFSGCANVRPLTETMHISHATQHVGSQRTNYGWNVVSVGMRWRPARGVTVDVLEGYSFEQMNGRHEVFTGRITVEFGAED